MTPPPLPPLIVINSGNVGCVVRVCAWIWANRLEDCWRLSVIGNSGQTSRLRSKYDVPWNFTVTVPVVAGDIRHTPAGRTYARIALYIHCNTVYGVNRKNRFKSSFLKFIFLTFQRISGRVWTPTLCTRLNCIQTQHHVDRARLGICPRERDIILCVCFILERAYSLLQCIALLMA